MTQIDIERVKLTRSHYNTMLNHVRKSLPREACGILLGKVIEHVALIMEVAPARNISSSKDLFSVDPEELYRILVLGENKGHEMIGVFHSHFLSSYPSGIDLSYMRLNSVAWLIFGLPSPDVIEVSAYQLSGNALRELELEIL